MLLSVQEHCSQDIDDDEHVAALDSCADDDEGDVLVAVEWDDKRVVVVARAEVRMKWEV